MKRPTMMLEYILIFLKGLATIYILIGFIMLMFFLFVEFSIQDPPEQAEKKTSRGKSLFLIFIIAIFWIFFLPRLIQGFLSESSN